MSSSIINSVFLVSVNHKFMQRPICFLFFSLLPFLAVAQELVYLADTGFITDIGANGASASAIYEPGGNYYGYDMCHSCGNALAQQFTVSAGVKLSIDTIILYGYQIKQGTTSPVTACYLQIFRDGPPGTGKLVWGDTTTNLLHSSGFTGTYRVWPNDTKGVKAHASNPDKFKLPLLYTNRPVMDLKLQLPNAPILPPGSYWLAWSAEGDKQHSGPWCPVKVKPGRINPTGQNSLKKENGKWTAIVDGGAPVGFNIIIKSASQLSINATPGQAIELYQNIPNPCNNSTKIHFSLKSSCKSAITIRNNSGQLITTIDNGLLSEGEHSVIVKTQNFLPGNYLYTLTTPNGVLTKTMVVE